MNVSQADVRTHSPAFAPCWDEEEKAPGTARSRSSQGLPRGVPLGQEASQSVQGQGSGQGDGWDRNLKDHGWVKF